MVIKVLEDNSIMKRVTIYDIAKEVGVSAATVSRAISGNGYVSNKNKSEIMALVDKYNFRPNTFAQNLQSGYTKTIGFIVPHIGNMYFANVYYEFEKWASHHGYMTILLNSKGDYETESKLLYDLKEKHVDGIVMMGGRVDSYELAEEYLNEINDIRKVIPFVICGPEAKRLGCSGVYIDDASGIENLLYHLKEEGYHRICLIGGGDEYYPSYIKKESAYKYGKKLGLDVSVRWLTGNQVFSYEAGYQGMKILISEGNLPDVVCGINDYVAIGVINAALEEGLKVPEDIAVTGYDNVSICTMTPIQITSVNPRYEYYGKKLFHCLHKLMLENNNIECKTTLIKPELIIRNSTR